MRKQKILEALKKAGKPLTSQELQGLTGLTTPRLRAELLRLVGEGRVERKQRGDEILWALKVPTQAELRFEKLAKKFTP